MTSIRATIVSPVAAPSLGFDFCHMQLQHSADCHAYDKQDCGHISLAASSKVSSSYARVLTLLSGRRSIRPRLPFYLEGRHESSLPNGIVFGVCCGMLR